MKAFFKKHYKKILIFKKKKKFLLVYFLFYSTAHAEGTYSGIYFTSYEENATIYLANYYPYAHFKDLRITSTTSKNLVNGRKHNLYSSIDDIDSVSGISGTQLAYLRQDSHLIDWNNYTTDWGMTLHEQNFIYALLGTMIGFVFMFFFILTIIWSF